MLFNAVSCTILLLLFALTCISAYVAMLSTVYSIIKDNYDIKKHLNELKNKNWKKFLHRKRTVYTVLFLYYSSTFSSFLGRKLILYLSKIIPRLLENSLSITIFIDWSFPFK